jgi:hypothetical protein
MHSFTVTREIAHDADTVWSLLANFADTFVYHPIVESSLSLNGLQTGLGAERQCVMYDGNRVAERITAFDASARRYTVEVFDHGPFPLTHMDVTIAVDDLGAAGSRVTYSGNFQPKFGPMGWVMGKLMMEAQFSKMMGSLIEGVDQHLETGRIVGKGGVLTDALAA